MLTLRYIRALHIALTGSFPIVQLAALRSDLSQTRREAQGYAVYLQVTTEDILEREKAAQVGLQRAEDGIRRYKRQRDGDPEIEGGIGGDNLQLLLMDD